MKTPTYSPSRAHYKETLDAVTDDREETRGTSHTHWSRRITDEHLPVHKFVATGDDVEVRIAACRYHYGD